jgi:hypothetical protein
LVIIIFSLVRVLSQNLHRDEKKLRSITEINGLLSSMGSYRCPNTRKYFESIERLIVFKKLPLVKLTDLLYNIVKYKLISAYENYHLYVQFQLNLKPLSKDTIDINQFSKQFYIIAYFSLVNKKPTPILEDYLSCLLVYLESKVATITKHELEDILLSLCAVDCLIRYGLLRNIWGSQLRPDIIETLNNMLLNEKTKTLKDKRFEELMKSLSVEVVNDARTNLIFVDYVIKIGEQVHIVIILRWFLLSLLKNSTIAMKDRYIVNLRFLENTLDLSMELNCWYDFVITI